MNEFNLSDTKREVEAREPLPSHAQCGDYDGEGRLLCLQGQVHYRDGQNAGCREHERSGCSRFDPDDPDVRRILLAQGWSPNKIITMAGCNCGERKYREAMAARELRMNANLPNQDDPKTFETFQMLKGNEIACTAVTQFTRGGSTTMLLVEGEMGGGKSHLLEAAGRRYLEAGVRVHYDTAASMVNQIRAVYGADSPDTVQVVIDWFKSFHVLIIDELCGDENITENARGWLFEIIDDRYRNHRRLIMATNKDMDEVAHKLGDRIASRLWSRSEPHVRHVVNEAGDYRMVRA